MANFVMACKLVADLQVTEKEAWEWCDLLLLRVRYLVGLKAWLLYASSARRIEGGLLGLDWGTYWWD
jgi:hypothetical protein